MTGAGEMEARPEGTQNLESSAKHSASFRERKEQHGNIGKGRVEATCIQKEGIQVEKMKGSRKEELEIDPVWAK